MENEDRFDLFAEDYLNDAEFMSDKKVQKLVNLRSKLIELCKTNYERGYHTQRFESLALDNFNQKLFPAGAGLASSAVIGAIAGSALVAMGSTMVTLPLSFLAAKGIKRLAGGTTEEIDAHKQKCRIDYVEANSQLIDVNRELMQMYKQYKKATEVQKPVQTSELDDYLNKHIEELFETKYNGGRSK